MELQNRSLGPRVPRADVRKWQRRFRKTSRKRGSNAHGGKRTLWAPPPGYVVLAPRTVLCAFPTSTTSQRNLGACLIPASWGMKWPRCRGSSVLHGCSFVTCHSCDAASSDQTLTRSHLIANSHPLCPARIGVTNEPQQIPLRDCTRMISSCG